MKCMCNSILRILMCKSLKNDFFNQNSLTCQCVLYSRYFHSHSGNLLLELFFPKQKKNFLLRFDSLIYNINNLVSKRNLYIQL